MRLDPITRTALRYTISPREYELLQHFLTSRAPRRVPKRTPSPTPPAPKTENGPKACEAGSATMRGRSDETAASVRAAIRMFAILYLGLRGWQTFIQRLAPRPRPAGARPHARFHNTRIALSLSSILFFHRTLYRFLRRIRVALLAPDSEAFRRRNPQVTHTLTSRYTPAVGAAMSGVLLGTCPAEQLRLTVAIYLFTRSLEFGFNALEENGYLWRPQKAGGVARPWWFGSWMLAPVAFGQLLHAFVFHRDCFPESVGRFTMQHSPGYIQTRPADYKSDTRWPGAFDIVDALATISRLHWPAFLSPVLFPNHEETLPMAIAHIAPITASAHPATLHTSCALLHPHDPSCASVYLKHFATCYPSMVRFVGAIYGAFALFAYRSLLKDPITFINRLSARILRVALFHTGAIGTAWASICLFSHLFPRNFLPTQRWFLGGFLAGLWGFVMRRGDRGHLLYATRLSLDSLVKLGKKHGWWRWSKHGDVLLFTSSLVLLDVIFEAHPASVRGAMVRKAVSSCRNEGLVDPLARRRTDDASAEEKTTGREEELEETSEDRKSR